MAELMEDHDAEAEVQLILDDDESSEEDAQSDQDSESQDFLEGPSAPPRSTLSQEESRTIHLIAYLKLSYTFWLGYLFPTTIALFVVIFLDGSSSCGSLFLWVIVQLALQIITIIVKLFSYFSLPYFGPTPDPSAVGAFQNGTLFQVIGWCNRLTYMMWMGWYATGSIWVIEILFGLTDCEAEGLFDLSISLLVLQILIVGFFMTVLCCNLPHGVRVPGASEELIRETTSTKIFEEGLLDSDHCTCAICLDDYVAGDELRFLPCSGLHHFHAHCVDAWLKSNKSCPLCKKPIDESPKNQLESAEGEENQEEEPSQENGQIENDLNV